MGPCRRVPRAFWRWLREEDGPTATEYAVMLALVIAVAITSITALGGKVNAYFGSCKDAPW